MKKTIAFLAAGLCAGTLLAGKDNVFVTFSSVHDTYSDGEPVRDGEYYAFVWTPKDETFAGFNADRTAAGNSKVAIAAPIAENGHCPRVQFQIDEGVVNEKYPGGTWGVYLLDTRKYQTQDVTITLPDGTEVVQKQVMLGADGKKVVTGVGGDVQGYGKVNGTFTKQFGSAEGGAVNVDKLPAGVGRPRITGIRTDEKLVYLTLEGTSPSIPYGMTSGTTPDNLKPTGDNPVLGGANGKTIFVTKKPAGNSAFFR